jgi:hypothetical protein
VKFGTDGLQTMPLRNYELGENRYRERHTLRTVVNIIILPDYIFRPVWIKFGIGNAHDIGGMKATLGSGT